MKLKSRLKKIILLILLILIMLCGKSHADTISKDFTIRDDLWTLTMDDLKKIDLYDDKERQSDPMAMCIEHNTVSGQSKWTWGGYVDIGINKDNNPAMGISQSGASSTNAMHGAMAIMSYYASEAPKEHDISWDYKFSFLYGYKNKGYRTILSKIGVDTPSFNGTGYRRWPYINYAEPYYNFLNKNLNQIKNKKGVFGVKVKNKENYKKDKTVAGAKSGDDVETVKFDGDYVGPIYIYKTIDDNNAATKTKSKNLVNNTTTYTVSGAKPVDGNTEVYTKSGNKYTKTTLDQIGTGKAIYIKIKEVEGKVTIKFTNKFKYYQARIFVLKGGDMQASAVWTGKIATHEMYAKVEADVGPDISVNKFIDLVYKAGTGQKYEEYYKKQGGKTVYDRIDMTHSAKEGSKVPVEPGDGVRFVIKVKNTGTGKAQVKLEDTFNSSIFERDTAKKHDGWTVSGNKLTRTVDVEEGKTYTYYVYLRVKNEATGEGRNKAQLSDFKVGSKTFENPSSSTTESDDYVKVKEYNYKITKEVYEIKDSSGNVTTNVGVGNKVTYRINIENTGEGALYKKGNLKLTENAPIQLKYVKHNTERWDKSGTTYTYKIKDSKDTYLKPGQNQAMAIRYQIVSGSPGETITNKITMDKPVNRNGVPVSESKTAKATITLGNSDYEIEKHVTDVNGNPSSDGATVIPGDEVTFEVTFKNTGDSDLSNIVINDMLSLHFNPTSISATGGGWKRVGTVFTYPGTVKAKKSAKFKITAKLNTEGLTVGMATNTATVAGFTMGVTPMPGGKSATASVNLRIPSMDTLEKVGTPYEVEPGDIVTYTLTIPNLYVGQADQLEINVTDTIPVEMEYFSGPIVIPLGLSIPLAGVPTSVSGNTLQFKIEGLEQRAVLGYTVTYQCKVKPEAVSKVTKEVQNSVEVTEKGWEIILTPTVPPMPQPVQLPEVEAMQAQEKTKILGYTAELTKYIMDEENDRREMSDSEKEANPVVVEKYDTIKYCIEFANTGPGTMVPVVKDTILDNAVKVISYTPGWVMTSIGGERTFTHPLIKRWNNTKLRS